jgi:aminopeptidase N
MTTSSVVAGESSIGDDLAPDLGNTGYDVQKYTLDLRLDPAADHLDAEVAIEAVSALDSLNRLSLDFIGFDFREVSANGKPVEFERKGNKPWVNLPQPVNAGQPFTVKVTYGGEPELFASRLSPGVPLGLYVNPETRRAYVLGEPDGARAWFPSNDHPLDPALFEFRVEVPKPLTAVTSGQQTSKEDLGDWTRLIYASDDPMATYLAAMAVGQYEEIAGRTASGVPLRHFVLPGSRAEAERIFADTAPAMVFLEETLGPYPFDSYGHVVIDSLEGIALETQTMTTWSQAFVTDIPKELAQSVLVHELAHQWVGDAIRLESWQDTWLKEGFATYMEVLWGERQGSMDADVSLREYEVAVHAGPG